MDALLNSSFEKAFLIYVENSKQSGFTIYIITFKNNVKVKLAVVFII